MKDVCGQGQRQPYSLSGLFGLCLSVVGLIACSTATAQENARLSWDPSPGGAAGYYLYYGTTSQVYTTKLNVGTNTSITLPGLPLGSNYYFAVSSYSAAGVESTLSGEISLMLPISPFLAGSDYITNQIEFLQFPDGNNFGYYNTDYYPWIYHYDLGFEYIMDSGNAQSGAYLYDTSSKTFWYTSPALFPFLYDFTLKAWLYYYPNTNEAGHYTSNPRYFYDFGSDKIITK